MRSAAAVRRSVVAGYFYPADAEAIRRQVRTWAAQARPARACAGAVVPHGPWRHAGAVAAATLASVALPERCIILGPNHTGVGAAWSLRAEGAYATPLGEVPIDATLAERLRGACGALSVDEQAHVGEHAIETLLPMLQALGPAGVQVAPIVGRTDRPDAWAAVGSAVAEVVRGWPEPILVIGSAELTQYAPEADVRSGDAALRAPMQRLDAEGFAAAARPRAVCSVGVISTVLSAMARLGAPAEEIAYATSADAGGDPDAATGYVGMVFG